MLELKTFMFLHVNFLFFKTLLFQFLINAAYVNLINKKAPRGAFKLKLF